MTLALLASVTGCATTFIAAVDSISDPTAVAAGKYVLVPGNEGVTIDDLQFQQFARYVERALSDSRLTPATSLEEDADVAILLAYGIGDPETVRYTSSVPVYGATGGGTATFNATTIGSGGSWANTTGMIHQPTSTGVVGVQRYTTTQTTYFRYVVLTGVDLNAYRASGVAKAAWRTTVTSRGGSGDLRRVFPVLVGAAAEHIATDTGQQVLVQLRENDKRVRQVTGKLD